MTDRHPNLTRFLDGLQEYGDPTAKMLLEGAKCPYQCRCALCLEWWAAIGPEQLSDKKSTWGPFTKAEIKHFKALREQADDQDDQ